VLQVLLLFLPNSRGSIAPSLGKIRLANDHAKGQLISEQNYAFLNFPKMQRKIARISALASKMGQIKKIKANFHTKL
jgi:hypothetical protein